MSDIMKTTQLSCDVCGWCGQLAETVKTTRPEPYNWQDVHCCPRCKEKRLKTLTVAQVHSSEHA